MSVRLLLLPAALLLVACEEKNSFAPPPPVPVGVQSVIVRDQQTYSEFPGRIEALQVVELRARVSGILESVDHEKFQPGKHVEKGTVLFRIDDTTYRARKATAEAERDQAEENLRLATYAANAKQNAKAGVSEIEKESALAEQGLAEAALKAAKAKVDIATEDLEYCTIAAPVSGRISELEVDQFNLVGTGEPTLLCTIVDDSSMHVYFEASEREALTFLNRRKGYETNAQTPPKATLTLADGTKYKHQAQVELADNRIDRATGTLRVRAVVDNPDGMLADGLFVRVKVPHPEVKEGAILVPTTALQQDLGGSFVLTVGEDNKVVRKNLTLGDRVERLRIVRSGLTGDEKIITVGLQRVREGVVVAPSEVKPETEPAPAPPAPAAN